MRAFVEAVAQAERSEDIRTGLLASYERGRELVSQLLLPDTPPGPQTRPVASLLLAIFDGLLIQWLLDPDQAPGGEELVVLATMLGPAAEVTALDQF